MEILKNTKEGRIFLLGMRRSGTSILRRLVSASPDVKFILFEPHDLYHSIMMDHFDRFRGPKHTEKILSFCPPPGKMIGAKIVFNPGVDALDWVWIPKTYPDAKMIFIKRDSEDTYQSYLKADKDSVRGVIPETVYSPMYQWIWGTMSSFARIFPERSLVLSYERLVENHQGELDKIWEFLGVRGTIIPDSILRIPENKSAFERRRKDGQE